MKVGSSLEPASERTERFDRQLRALGAGRQGRIVAAFASAASAELQPDGRLLTLLEAGRPLVPFGVEVPLGRLRPAVGAAVTLEDRTLRIGGTLLRLEGEGSSLRLAEGPLSLPLLRRQLEGIALPERTRRLLRGGGAEGGESVEARLERRAGAALRELVLALCQREPARDAIEERVRALTGLGPGSTPTGDDVLVGVAAAALRLRDGKLLASEGARQLMESLDALPNDSTAPLARGMLENAARGEFLEPLVQLVSALGRREEAALARRIEALAAVGAHSGADMLAGVMALALAGRSSPGGLA